ncbi:MAG: Gfo/Idh/MocA family oxidoreductase [Candidatus Rokubacteria bacterium]|nr:Gfo/Idh/MocA family oxidoreductase [Candidatus Rokubacteria bacterium]
MAKQIGYAVLGLGAVVRTSILPAFATNAGNMRLVAVVSGDRAEAQVVAREFKAAAYHFEELRQCLQREDVNAVYIAVPNSLHCEYAVEAARAGVHVLCEPPMAMTADECRRMIRTCQTNRVKLMIAYRLRFRPAVLKTLSLVRTGHIGIPKTFSSDFTTRVEDPDSPRLQRRLGGGTVYHLGVECIHAARTVLGVEPAQVMAMTARTSRRYGGDVDEGAVALIRFPDERLAHFHTSFGEEPISRFTVFGEEGWITVEHAYSSGVPTRVVIARRGECQEQVFDPSDEFAATIAYFADCIREDRQPEPSGVDGLQDTRLVEAIYRSSRDGRPVTLPRLARVEPGPLEPEARRLPIDGRQAG